MYIQTAARGQGLSAQIAQVQGPWHRRRPLVQTSGVSMPFGWWGWTEKSRRRSRQGGGQWCMCSRAQQGGRAPPSPAKGTKESGSGSPKHWGQGHRQVTHTGVQLRATNDALIHHQRVDTRSTAYMTADVDHPMVGPAAQKPPAVRFWVLSAPNGQSPCSGQQTTDCGSQDLAEAGVLMCTTWGPRGSQGQLLSFL